MVRDALSGFRYFVDKVTLCLVRCWQLVELHCHLHRHLSSPQRFRCEVSCLVLHTTSLSLLEYSNPVTPSQETWLTKVLDQFPWILSVPVIRTTRSNEEENRSEKSVSIALFQEECSFNKTWFYTSPFKEPLEKWGPMIEFPTIAHHVFRQ